MTTYPVHYRVDRPQEMSRLQLAIRLVAFIAIGALGISIGGLFLFAFLALPVIAAIRTSGERPAGRVTTYATDDGPKIIHALRWWAAICGWLGLVTDRLPAHAPDETITIEVEGVTHPTPASAMWRVLSGIPSALVLAVLGAIGSLVWLWAVLTILFTQRIGPGAFSYLVGLQRWSVRLLAYQASLVDDYPPFSFEETAPIAMPPAHVAAP